MKRRILIISTLVLATTIITTSCLKDLLDSYEEGKKAGEAFCDCISSQTPENCDDFDSDKYLKYEDDEQFLAGFAIEAAKCKDQIPTK